MVRTFLLATLLAGVVACAPPAADTPRTLDAARTATIGAAIRDAVDAGEIPGAVAYVALDGDVVYHEAFGYADIASGQPAGTDTIYRIASMTKAITATAVMMLAERGDLLLNDPVADYLPGFANMQVVETIDEAGNVTATVPARQPIRIIHLLTHTAGIAYPFLAGDLQKTYLDTGIIDGLTTADTTLAEQMQLLAQQPLLFEPGTRFNYGLSSDVLGYLVEVVCGQTLDEFFRENIFMPLGMKDTHFYLPAADAGRLAMLYAVNDQGALVGINETSSDISLDDLNYPVSGARRYFSGGAGLSSTAADYGRFLQMLLDGGTLEGQQLLSRKSVELMRAPRIDVDNDGINDISLAFRVVSDLSQTTEPASVGTYSWGGAFYTVYWVDPAEDLVMIFMSQGRPLDSTIDRRFRTLVYQALP